MNRSAVIMATDNKIDTIVSSIILCSFRLSDCGHGSHCSNSGASDSVEPWSLGAMEYLEALLNGWHCRIVNFLHTNLAPVSFCT